MIERVVEALITANIGLMFFILGWLTGRNR